jgi:hypothetical protein
MPASSVDKEASVRLATYGLGITLLQALQGARLLTVEEVLVGLRHRVGPIIRNYEFLLV